MAGGHFQYDADRQGQRDNDRDERGAMRFATPLGTPRREPLLEWLGGLIVAHSGRDLLLRGRRPALSYRRFGRRIGCRSLAQEADRGETNDDHDDNEEEDHVA